MEYESQYNTDDYSFSISDSEFNFIFAYEDQISDIWSYELNTNGELTMSCSCGKYTLSITSGDNYYSIRATKTIVEELYLFIEATSSADISTDMMLEAVVPILVNDLMKIMKKNKFLEGLSPQPGTAMQHEKTLRLVQDSSIIGLDAHNSTMFGAAIAIPFIVGGGMVIKLLLKENLNCGPSILFRP